MDSILLGTSGALRRGKKSRDGARHGGVLLDALGAVPVISTERIEVYEAGGEKLVCHLQVPPVEKLLIRLEGLS